MVDQDKTKPELIAEIHQLQLENSLLKALHDKDLSDFNQRNDLIQNKIMNFEAVFESSPVAMLIIDETTNIVMVNLTAVKLCGGSEADILQHRPGNALRCVHSTEDPRGCGFAKDCKICQLRNGVESLIANGGTINGAELEMELIRNGKPQKVWINVGIEPLLKDEQKLWCIAMNDVTQHKETELRLKESQTLLNSIIDSTNDMIWSVDSNYFGLLQWNTSFHDYFLNDRGIEIGLGMTPKDLFPEDSEFISFWTDLFSRTLKEGSYSTEYETFSGTRILRINLELLVENGKTLGITVFAKNITAQKKAEIKLLKANRLYAVISQVNQALVYIKEKDKLLNEICQIAVDFGNFQMAWVGLVDETTQLVKPHSVAGFDNGYLTTIKQIKATDTPEGRGPTGRCIREGKYIVCNDYAHDPNLAIWREEALKRNFHSSIALPIKQQGKAIGAFTLYASNPDFFDEQEILLLTGVADDISFALETIELEQKHQQSALALAKSEDQFRGIFNNLQDAFFKPIFQETLQLLAHLPYECMGTIRWTK
ncbi:MAG: GAF domain-containing protein [Prolixibacteraceae bacterium]|nr:GAF domain-containing protein [Prolixibacteraceae bacterium]